MPAKLARFKNTLRLHQLFRELTQLETNKLFTLLSLYNGASSRGKEPGIDEILLFNNFSIQESGAMTGYVAVFRKAARVYRDPFPHNMFHTKALFEITDTDIAGAEITADSLRRKREQALTLAAVATTLAEGENGFAVDVSGATAGKFNDAACTPELGVGGACSAGTVYYIEKTRGMKQKFFVCVDVCQGALARQASAHISNACTAKATFGTMLDSPELIIDGVSSTSVFARGSAVGLRAASAIATNIQEALGVVFARNPQADVHGVGDRTMPRAEAHTTENCFYDGPNSDQVTFYCGVQNTTAHATAIFTDLALNGFFTISGPKVRTQYESANPTIFDGSPWPSMETFNGILSNIGRRMRLDEVDPEELSVAAMDGDLRRQVERHFVWDALPPEATKRREVGVEAGGEKGGGGGAARPLRGSMSHMFCQKLVVGDAGSEALASLEDITEFALGRCHEGDEPLLRLTRLIPITMKTNATRLCDLRQAPGDSFDDGDNDTVAVAM